MKKWVWICLLLLCGAAFLLVRASDFGGKYRQEDMIGRTSAEIEQKYGTFDCPGMPKGEDGLYRSTKCGYTIREAKRGFLGASGEVLFFILFDENGIAVSCETGHRPGG